MQTSVKVAANVAHIALTDPSKASPVSGVDGGTIFKGGIGDLAVPNRRKGRIIQDLEDRRSHAPNLRRTTLSRAGNRLSKRRDGDVWPT